MLVLEEKILLRKEKTIMEKNREVLDKAMNIIFENTTDDSIKKMISVVKESSDNDNIITDEMLDKLGQYTYEDYANKGRKK